MRYLTMLLLLSFAAAAYASTFGQSMRAIGWDSFGFVVLFALGGGVVSSLRKAATPGVGRMHVEVIKDLVASAVAGMLAFFAAAAIGAPDMAIAFAVTIAGYGGSVVLDRFLGRYLRKVDEGEG
jgi:hypothetical protein